MGSIEDIGGKQNSSSQPAQTTTPAETATNRRAVSYHVIPYSHNALASLAELIIKDNRDSLPDLTNNVILISQSRAAPWLRRELLQAAARAGHAALLGPHVETLSGWVSSTLLPGVRTVSDQTRELLLVEALREHPDLFGEGSPYSLAVSLLELFDELTAHYVELPDSLPQFQTRLEQAYGINRAQLSALGKEATLVHTLWQAMRRQLREQQSVDTATAYIAKLARKLSQLSADTRIYLGGFHDFTRAQWQWLEQVAARAPLTIVVQGEAMPGIAADSPYAAGARSNNEIARRLQARATTQPQAQLELDFAAEPEQDDLSHCLDMVFNPAAGPIKSRAAQCAQRFALDPLARHLRVYEAGHSEAEANAIDLQVRRWLAQGLTHIGIVTENRRLARRVRALLERAGIVLQDTAGWALSTTSAATIVERWLQCVEEDFHYVPFLDFLKSPFVFARQERASYLQTVYYLEQNIILDENVADGLLRYRDHAIRVRERLAGSMATHLDAIPSLLDAIEQAAQPLCAALGEPAQPPGDYLRALLHSLQALGVAEALRADAAGNQLLNLLDKLLAATDSIHLKMRWVEFRAWLGSHLERGYFQPANAQSPIQLMSLAQSDLQPFEALIIAAAQQQFLPGSPGQSPFFNDAVRASLGIPTAQQKQNNRFYYFRRLLQSTGASTEPRILITRTLAENGEELLPSPWLEAIVSFHRLAYSTTLQDEELKFLLEQTNSQYCNESEPLPNPMATHPAAVAPPSALPQTVSATAYQQLMNCPYQFFAARCLRLSPPDSVREMLQKDEYGNKVHLCLQAFHSKVAGLPGPFEQTFCEANKPAAVELLSRISRQVFARHIEDNFIHRGWLKRWLDLVPRYIDWQIDQAQNWQVYAVEKHSGRISLSPRCTIKGQLDRIDRSAGGFKIIDYKTGQVPSKDDVRAGEAVQLPFYALLMPSIADMQTQRVEYLSLDPYRFGSDVFIEGDELNALKAAVADRLVDIVQALHEGGSLPAWGDSHTCNFCAMAGLCRKGMWSEADKSAGPGSEK